MPVITTISTQKKVGFYNIFLDGQYAFSVTQDTLVKFNLHKGQELSTTDLAQINATNDFFKLYTKALNYLSYQLRSTKEVYLYLLKENPPENLCIKVIQTLTTKNLLNDTLYAQSFVRTMAKTSDKGPSVIKTKLRQKGILENDITNALTEFSSTMQLQNATKLAHKLAHKYQNQNHQIKLQKIKQTLIKKGFSAQISQQALDELNLTIDEENETSLLTKLALKTWQKNQRFAYFERYQKTKQFLYRKGFNLSDIERCLDEITQQ